MDKYIDNKLAEELDLIVMTTNAHAREGVPPGTVGTLIESYTGHENPLCGIFPARDGSNRETEIGLHDFRVLNPCRKSDAEIIVSFLRNKKAI